MSMQFSFPRISIYIIVSAAVLAVTLFNIADLDFWWHLKTGDVILQQKEFQKTEIYSFTANGLEYIDHEWLFQVLVSLVYAPFGPAGIILLKSAAFVLLYFLTTKHLLQMGASPLAVISIQFVSICGGFPRMIERPEIFTALFFVITFLIVHSFLKTGGLTKLLILPPLFSVWSNFHAAVILGLVLLVCVLGGVFIETLLKRWGFPAYYNVTVKQQGILVILLISCALATGLNPYGYRVLLVPFELTSIIDSGILNNDEWKRPSPFTLPFYYVCVLLSFTAVLLNFRRISMVHFFLMVFFAYISMKYIRNTGLFCWFMPLFLAPYVAHISENKVLVNAASVFSGLALLYLTTIAFPFERGMGIASYFPDRIANFTEQKNLQGNMLNSYAFGGYLIWALYPERTIFIDGRNEVYLSLLKKIVQSRADSRLWNRLLGEYKIEYALLNYVDELEEVTYMGKNGEPTIIYMPFSETHFPRSKWALVYWDDDGMILIKRTGVNTELLTREFKQVYPEGFNYMEALLQKGRIPREQALRELERKLKEDPNCKRAQKMLQIVKAQ